MIGGHGNTFTNCTVRGGEVGFYLRDTHGNHFDNCTHSMPAAVVRALAARDLPVALLNAGLREVPPDDVIMPVLHAMAQAPQTDSVEIAKKAGLQEWLAASADLVAVSPILHGIARLICGGQ